MKPLIWICIITLFLIKTPCFAQINTDINLLYNCRDIQSSHEAFNVSSNKIINELQFVLTSFFIGYKLFISSQDINVCTFHPSCSVYALQTIEKHGLIIGLFDAFDRLNRCNGLSPEKYPVYKNFNLLYDPVD